MNPAGIALVVGIVILAVSSLALSVGALLRRPRDQARPAPRRPDAGPRVVSWIVLTLLALAVACLLPLGINGPFSMRTSAVSQWAMRIQFAGTVLAMLLVPFGSRGSRRFVCGAVLAMVMWFALLTMSV